MLEYSLNGQFISDNLSCIYMHVNFGRNIYASMYINMQYKPSHISLLTTNLLNVVVGKNIRLD